MPERGKSGGKEPLKEPTVHHIAVIVQRHDSESVKGALRTVPGFLTRVTA